MLLEGKKGLVLNVTNQNSLGWAIADAAHAHGAEVGVGAQAERTMTNVLKLIDGKERMGAVQVEFQDAAQLDALVQHVEKTYGKIDFLVHSAAFAPKEALQNPFIETSEEAFQTALGVSCYSLIALCRALEPVMNDDASVVTLSYLGSQRAVPKYNVMGVAKAALEASVRYLSLDLGVRGIRVNTISPGPVNTVAARGVPGLIEMIRDVRDKAPLKRDAAQSEVGGTGVYLLSDLSRGVTGQVVYVDSGYSIVGLV